MKQHKRFLIGSGLKILMQLLILAGLMQGDFLNAYLCGFLTIFGISAWEMRLFTRKTSSVGAYAREFLPYLLWTGLLFLLNNAAMIGLLIAASRADDTHAPILSMTALFYYLPCSIFYFLSALLIFLIGAVRTVLYRK